jgi:hypothetical protein
MFHTKKMSTTFHTRKTTSHVKAKNQQQLQASKAQVSLICIISDYLCGDLGVNIWN